MQKNTPDLWMGHYPIRQKDGHKYDAGLAFIYAAPGMTGATRLAATSCARIGAGLVTVLCSPETYDVYRSSLPAHIITRKDVLYKNDKMTARLYGSGGLACDVDFDVDMPSVLDADALRSFPRQLSDQYVLTPHEGEFSKLFPEITGDRYERALSAAKQTNAVIVLKGEKTIIASPDGSLVENDNALPVLATAGTGDVLAGMITGLMAQGMPSFEASCAAVWMHGEASHAIGYGLIASDIELALPKIISRLIKGREKTIIGFL